MKRKIESIFCNAEKEGRNVLLEHEVYKVLDTLGIRTPKHELLKGTEGLEDKLKNYDKLVVLKIVSPDIFHKTEYGGVEILENDPELVELSYEKIINNVKRKNPEARIEGVLLSECIPIEREVLVSLVYDQHFDHFISVAAGGIYTELYKDFAFRLSPAEKNEVKDMLKELKSYPLLSGFRGGKKVNEDNLIKNIIKVMKLTKYFSIHGSSKYLISELEVNPFASSGDKITAIDGLLRFERKAKKEIAKPNLENLDLFFKPKTVAVIGASEDKDKFGHDKVGKVVFENMLASNIENVYPVNPSRETILGKKCYKSIKDIEGEVDLAVVTVPAKIIPSVVEDIKQKGVKATILIGGGFGELCEEGKELEKKIKKILEQGGIRAVGPNCLGTYSKDTKLKTLFLPETKFTIPDKSLDNLTILTQSGAVGVNLVESLPNVGIGYFVGYGNMIDVDLSDLVKYFEKERGTDIIGIYSEGFKDGRKFYNTVKDIKKPIVIIKGGKTDIGAKATMSHTGSVAGNYKVASAAFKQGRIIEANTSQEFFDILKIFSYYPKSRVSGNKIAIISNAGGLGVLSADYVTKTCLKLAEYTEITKERLEKYFENYLNVNNPTDLGGGISDENFIKCLHIVLLDHNVDAAIISPGVETVAMNEKPFVERAIKVIRYSDITKPVVITMADTDKNRSLMKLFEDNRVPCYITPEQGVRALALYMQHKLTYPD